MILAMTQDILDELWLDTPTCDGYWQIAPVDKLHEWDICLVETDQRTEWDRPEEVMKTRVWLFYKDYDSEPHEFKGRFKFRYLFPKPQVKS